MTLKQVKINLNIEFVDAIPSDMDALSNLCMRSKQYWGYSDEFMALCRQDLTLTMEDFENSFLTIAKSGCEYCGLIQINYQKDSTQGVLDKLFIHPDYIGLGIGQLLYNWGVDKAKENNICELIIDADPHAEHFYTKQGAVKIQDIASTAIPGRYIPQLKVILI